MELSLIALTLLYSLLGGLLGTCSGMTPGLHVNTLSLLLVAGYPLLEPPIASSCSLFGADGALAPLLLACLIVSAAIAHSFVDFVPSTFLGVPDEASVLSILPGHRLLLAGKGVEAVAFAAKGSLVGAMVAVLATLPLQILLSPPFSLDHQLKPIIPWMLVVVAAALILSERGKAPAVACLDVREGSAHPSPDTISIVAQVPVDGKPAELIGIVARSKVLGRAVVRTSYGRYRIKGFALPLEGRYRLTGSWRVRRPTLMAKLAALAVFSLSGALGLVAMDARAPFADVFTGLGQSMLFPLLTGLFGLPSLVLSMRSGPVPRQDESVPAPAPVRAGLLGSLAGFASGWLPGITSTSAAVLFAPMAREGGGSEENAKRFIHMVSAVGTASAVFSVLAFVLLGKVRSGSMVAVQQVLGNEQATSSFLALFLLAVLVASAIGYFAAIGIARCIANRVGGRDLGLVNRALFVVLVALIAFFTGIPGILIATASLLLGLLPPRIGIGRVHLTGCLLLPITLALFGLDEAIIASLSR
ncbi:MAG TPA: tripartite tricarboxylate transporter permease [Methanomassiliicoccales archaeon]|nr:tripartite tricarboxylate transporter permease [Methanomassiliicoccales archaeon]